MKKISVVIAAYNEENNLPNCLSAIRAQSFPKSEYEIIVVDNNSTDKTAEIAKSFDARVINEEKQGNTYAAKKGMDSARYEVIAMVDADTIVDKNWLLEISNAFENEKVVGLTGMGLVKTNNKLFGFIEEKIYELFLRLNFLIGKPHLTGFNLAVRKSAYDAILGIDENFSMSPDIDLGLRIKTQGKVIFNKKVRVMTSIRRWQENPFKTFYVYLVGYIWTVWLRKPPPVGQKPVR